MTNNHHHQHPTTTNTYQNHKFPHLTITTHPPPNHQIIQISLNRPRKRNALNSTLWRDIGLIFSLLGTTPDDHRCVILAANGPSFCAGIDTTETTLADYVANDDADVSRKILSFRPQILEMQRAFTSLETCPIPVIAAVHGACIGAGVDLICAADVRLCSPSAVFSVREVRLGLAADVGVLQRLPKIVGCGSRVRELCLTGGDFDAAEAVALGFVSRVADSEEALRGMAWEVAKRIARNSPVAVVATKEVLNYSRDRSVQEGLEHVANLNAGLLLTNDLGDVGGGRGWWF